MGSDYFPVDDSKQKKDISAIVNTVFIITKHNGLFSDNPVQEQIIWSSDMIPGYKLVPYINDMKKDVLANTYDLKIDWQLVNEEAYTQKLKKYHNKDGEQSPEFQKEIAGITAHSVIDRQDIIDNSSDDETKKEYQQQKDKDPDIYR